MFPENNQFLQRQGISVLKIACVAWRFWLGALSNKGGRGQRNCEEIGFYFFTFLAALPLVLVRFACEFRGFAARAPYSTKPPCYAGYFINKMCFADFIFSVLFFTEFPRLELSELLI